MSQIDEVFQRLRAQNQKALIPFITAGDPDLDFTADLLREFHARGVSLCELGIPYSDPIADGPVIQASYTRALAGKIRVRQIMQMAGELAGELSFPLISMVSYAIILRQTMERYVASAKAAGFAGAIVPDLLVEESEALAAVCRREDFSLIQLVTPTTPRERAVRIGQNSTGFLYYVSVTGITGERNELPAELVENASWLREQTDTPVCIGFGISRPEHVRLLAPAADGLIVGSAIMRRVANAGQTGRQETVKEVGEYFASLLEAIQSV